MSHPPADDTLVLTTEQLDPPAPGPEADRRLTMPADETLPIALPRMPKNRADLLAMIRDRVPLPPGDLAWTAPRPTAEGGAELTVARKAGVAALAAPFARGSLVYDGRSGLPFEQVGPGEHGRMGLTLAICAASLAVAAWALTAAPAKTDHAAAAGAAAPPSATVGPAFVRGGIDSSLGIASRLVARGWVLSRIGMGADGALQIDLAGDDPDALRAKAADDPDLGAFREVAQVRAPQGGYRIGYERRAATQAGPTVAVAPLVAADAYAAAETVEDSQRGMAAARAVRITLARARPSPARPLEFSLDLAGPQDEVLAVARAIEASDRPMRFTDWALAPDGGGVRFSATLVVPWARRP